MSNISPIVDPDLLKDEFLQRTPWPPAQTLTLPANKVWTSSGTIQMSERSDPTDWSAKSTIVEYQSEMNFGGVRMQVYDPPPNLIRRLIWKWALGVTWRDLRPERDMETLKGLK